MFKLPKHELVHMTQSRKLFINGETEVTGVVQGLTERSWQGQKSPDF